MKLDEILTMKKHLLLIFLLITTLVAAQRPGGGTPPMGTISGSLTDASGNQALEFATIAIYAVRDSSLVGGEITDAKGKFSVEVKPGRYYAKIKFIGYGEKIVSDIKIGRESMLTNLGSIALEASDLQLDEVTVQGERTQMELQLDKKVYNTVIPRNVRLAEAPSFGVPVLLHDARSRGALAYLALAEEVICSEAERPQVSVA